MLYFTNNHKRSKALAIRIDEQYLKMSDGTRLYTQIFLRDGLEKAPVILVRCPYVEKDADMQNLSDVYYDFLNRGYAVVFQHCRGCGFSEGDCIPYDFERRDGLDTLAQIRDMPFYHGEIFLSGGSYLSSVHFSYLDTVPSDVKGAVLCIQDIDRYNINYQNGFFKVGLHGEWFVGMYKKNSMPRKNYTRDSFRMLPLSAFSETVFGEKVPAFDETLRHPDRNDPFWKTPAGGSDYANALKHLKIPLLLVTAFHDIYTEGVFRMWDSIPEDIRSKCALIVTPYEHGYNYSPSYPVEFEGGSLDSAAPDFAGEWFDSIRKGTKNTFAEPGRIKWYELFAGKWHTAKFLENGSGKRVFHLDASHRLSDGETSDREITYLYNPYAPAKFNGGCCYNFDGMRVQDPPDSRYDIISFVSEPFDREASVRGTMEVELKVRSEAPDTCFYVRFSLVRNGIAYGMRDNIDSLARQNPEYVPGNTAFMKFRLTEHAFRIAPGDRIRLDVSSSCWPNFVPHTNRAGLFSEQTTAVPTHNTLVCGRESRLILPVVVPSL